MKRLVLIVSALFVLSCLSFAQYGSTETGTSDSTGKSVTGCLSGPNSQGAYELKSKGKSIEVGGNDELKNHVGHEVRLTGTWAKSGTEVGETEKSEQAEKNEGAEAHAHATAKGEAGEASEKNERHMKVTKIDMVSTTCSEGAK